MGFSIFDCKDLGFLWSCRVSLYHPVMTPSERLKMHPNGWYFIKQSMTHVTEVKHQVVPISKGHAFHADFLDAFRVLLALLADG